MLSPDTILQNRYRIIRELRHGGMGTVYEALDQRTNCLVALKEMFATQDPEAKRAFEREAGLLANLRNPSLPKVIDYFSEDEADFLVMEFIPGYDLAELLELRGSPFPESQVLRWAYELLRLLEYLHGHQPPILHRDIKPSNLKLTKQGEIFLLDFGLAKGAVGQMPTLLTSRSVRGYTPVYAALEQITGHGTDARSDLYSLGATLYHLLTGVAPIDAPARFSAIEEERPDPLRAITELNSQVSPKAASVIHQAMAISRKQRPISATEMRKALRDAAEEDERSSAEEEYRRAEARHRELEEEKQRAVLAANQRGEDEQRLQEAESVRNEDEARHRAAAAAAKREAEQRSLRQAQLQVTGAPPTVREQRLPQGTKTMRVPAREQSTFDQISGDTVRDDESGPIGESGVPIVARVPKSLSLMVGAMLLLVLVTAIGIIVLSIKRKTAGQNTASPTLQSPVTPVMTDTTSANNPKSTRNQIGIEMVWIPPGTFTMGPTDAEVQAAYDNAKCYHAAPLLEWFTREKPRHQVKIREDFFMARNEVTQGQWLAVMSTTVQQQRDKTNSYEMWGEGDQYPMYYINWNEVQEFIERLNQMSDGYRYRLPTEAEWEYACRAGTTTAFAFGDSLNSDQANFNGKCLYGGVGTGVNRGQTTPVGSFQPNAWGLYDMHGNVWEWCQDWYHDSYNGAPTDGSAWLSGGEQKDTNCRQPEDCRVLRGGAWSHEAYDLRSAARGGRHPGDRGKSYGFRVVAVARTG